MAQGTVGNASGKAVILKNGWVGDASGKARKVVKGWVGDASGKARLCYSSGMKIIPRTIIKGNNKNMQYIVDGSTVITKVATNITDYIFLNTAFIDGMFAAITYITSGSNNRGYWTSDDGITWTKKGEFNVTTSVTQNYGTLVEASNGTIYYCIHTGGYTAGNNGGYTFTDYYDYYLACSKDGGKTWTVNTYQLGYLIRPDNRYNSKPTVKLTNHIMSSLSKSKTGEVYIWSNYGAGFIIDKAGNITTDSTIFGEGLHDHSIGYDDSDNLNKRYKEYTMITTDGSAYLQMHAFFDNVDSTGYYGSITGDWSGRTTIVNQTPGNPLQTFIDGVMYNIGYGDGKVLVNFAEYEDDEFSKNHMWVSTTSLMNSTLSWTKAASANAYRGGYTFDGTRHLMRTGTVLYYSIDGLTWTKLTTSIENSCAIGQQTITHGSFCGGQVPG